MRLADLTYFPTHVIAGVPVRETVPDFGGDLSMTVFRAACTLSLFSLSIIALGVSPSAVRAEDSPVGRIIAVIDTSPTKLRTRDQILTKIAPFKVGEAYDEAKAAAAVQKLVSTGWFAVNSIELKTLINQDGKVIVSILMKELAGTVKDIIFIGNQHYSFDELYELMQVRRGNPMNPALNKLAAAAIANKMRDDGRFYASCVLLEGDNATDTRVVFNIVEGPTVRVGKVSFLGNQEASDARLRTIVGTNGALLGRTTILTPKYQPPSINKDKELLEFYYAKLGFLDARIEAEVLPFAADLSSVHIVYHVHEGRAYNVRNVRFEGNKAFQDERLRKVIGLQTGERYDESLVQADTQRITMLYGNGGHQVGVKREYYAIPNTPGVVDVCYRVFEPDNGYGRGPDRIGIIKIEGNQYTEERVIRNELGRLLPGQVLEYPLIKTAEGNLARRGIFDPEEPPQIFVVPSERGDQFKDLVVKVKETRTGMVGLQVGVNSNAGLNGTLAINQRNFDITKFPRNLDDLIGGNSFRGGGQEFRIQAMPGTQFSRYEVTWREPFLFDSKYGLTTSFYYADRLYNEYTEARYGGRFTLDYRFDNAQTWHASLATRVEGVNLTNIPTYATPAITDFAGQHFQVGLRAGLNRDTRDSFLMPSTGTVIDVGVEQIMGDYTFPIGTAEATKFWTLHQARDGGWKGVVAARSQLSATTANAPVYERFFAGGFRSLRGFAFRGVGPFENTLNTGGTFSWLNTLEYQIPLVANEKLRFVTFVDHGTVDNSATLANYRVSVGMGLRIQIPAMGPMPIALDFGFPVMQGPGDIKQVFSFYVGWIGGQ
jgi:outer membrane protein assembly complex protein YaeT